MSLQNKVKFIVTRQPLQIHRHPLTLWELSLHQTQILSPLFLTMTTAPLTNDSCSDSAPITYSIASTHIASS